MKTGFAIIAIAAAIFSLQSSVAVWSSSNGPQSALDPQTIQEEESAQQKLVKRSKHNSSRHNSSRHNNSNASVSQGHQRSQLAEALDYDPGSLKTYQKSLRSPTKSPYVQANKRQKKDKARSNLSSKQTTPAGSDKNMFVNGAEAAGRLVTAPVRGFHALFKHSN